MVVSTAPEYSKDPVVYRGQNLKETFFERLLDKQKRINNILAVVTPMEITAEEERQHQQATVCYHGTFVNNHLEQSVQCAIMIISRDSTKELHTVNATWLTSTKELTTIEKNLSTAFQLFFTICLDMIVIISWQHLENA